ncbi:MAG: hypothetical protein WED00_12405 [Aquisalimonadaceae bacterium]
MADPGHQPSQPSTPEEADAYEKPIRKQVYIGIAVGLALIVVLIVTVMEVRYRATLGQPRASAALDGAMQEVMAPISPLPQVVRVIEVLTSEEADTPTYEVLLRDGDGELLYHQARRAGSLYMLESGSRAGTPVHFDVSLAVDVDGQVTGRYRPDRGVPVANYQAVLRNLVREALVGFQVQSIYPLVIETVEDDEHDQAALRRDWEAVID